MLKVSVGFAALKLSWLVMTVRFSIADYAHFRSLSV